MSREGFLSNLKATLDFGNVMNKYIPVVKTIIGAGFGIPYDDSQRNLDLTGLNAQVEELVSQYPFVKQNETKFAVESGRFLVGQSGVYVTRIIDMKNSRGTNYAITDGGVHHMTRIPLLRDKSIGQDLVKYPIFNLSNNRQPLIGIDIAGCLCTPLDKLGKHVGLSSETKVGDYLGVFCAGAYGFSEGMVNFLSHDVPAEVLVHNNKYDIVNPSLSARELADREIIPYDLMEKR